MSRMWMDVLLSLMTFHIISKGMVVGLIDYLSGNAFHLISKGVSGGGGDYTFHVMSRM